MLSATAEYAIRAMTFLASQPEGTPVCGSKLAAEIQAPTNYLSKVLNTLGRARLVDSSRGAGGGYCLASHPEELPLLAIVNLFDLLPEDPPKFLASHCACTPDDPCPPFRRWRRVHEAYLRFLSLTTLAELAACSAPPETAASREPAGKELGKEDR